MVFEILDRDLLSIKQKFWKAETELMLDVFRWNEFTWRNHSTCLLQITRENQIYTKKSIGLLLLTISPYFHYAIVPLSA